MVQPNAPNSPNSYMIFRSNVSLRWAIKMPGMSFSRQYDRNVSRICFSSSASCDSMFNGSCQSNLAAAGLVFPMENDLDNFDRIKRGPRRLVTGRNDFVEENIVMNISKYGGLIHSRLNAEFLMKRLKSLGRERKKIYNTVDYYKTIGVVEHRRTLKNINSCNLYQLVTYLLHFLVFYDSWILRRFWCWILNSAW